MEEKSLKTRMMTFLVCLLVLTSFSVTVLADSYLYDKNGNMVQEQTASGNKCYIYNSANQLVKVTDCAASPKTIAEYSYDQTGRRIRTIEYLSSGTVTTYYPFDDYETVVGGTKAGNTVYYFANGERVARKDPDSTIHYYHGDHLGSTSMITSSTGAVEENTKYYPFGAVRSGGAQSKYLYTGKEQDTETGLYYYGARYYNPNLMHFTQADSQIPNLYDPQSLNRYSYVKNNPVKYTDPSGHQAYVEASYDMVLALAGLGLIFVATAGPPIADKFSKVATKSVQAVGGVLTAKDMLDFSGSLGKATGEQVFSGQVSEETKAELELNFIFMVSFTDVPGEKSAVKAARDQWSKGTFKTAEESAKYHFEKHYEEVGTKTVEEYTEKAKNFYDTYKNEGTKVVLKNNQEGLEIVKDNLWGRYTTDGKIISFGKTIEKNG